MKSIKSNITLLSLVAFSFCSINKPLIFTTNCIETFHYFFLTEGETPTFWIGIDVSGECYSSHLVQIGDNDSSVSVLSSELQKYGNWNSIPELKSKFLIQEEDTLVDKENSWISKDIEISSPEYDSSLANKFNEHIMAGGSNAITWYKENGEHGLVLPKIAGLNTKLIYRHSRGLYFNYQISEIHYYKNDYILVFTHQSRTAVGNDSMNGFLIFRIIK